MHPIRARILVASVVIALCAPVLTQLPAEAAPVASALALQNAVPVQPVPPTPGFTSAIEPYADYLGQTLCSPTAKPGLNKLAALLRATYGPRDIGIARSCSDGGQSEHKEGRALDWMTSVAQRPQADAFLKWLLAPDAFGNPAAMARRLGVMYIGWDNRMWRAYDPSLGWSDLKGCTTDPKMKAASYDTTCHRDHVHISFSWDGAQGTTSYWTGKPVLVPDCARRTAAVPATTAGSVAAPVVLLDTATGAGTTAKTACRLGAERWAGDDRTLHVSVPVPVAPSGARYELQVRVDRYDSNAPGSLFLDTTATTPVGVLKAGSIVKLPISTAGVVDVSVNAGQAYVRLLGLGLVAVAATSPSPPPSNPTADGAFVQAAGAAAVYRMAGGAPLYVSAWSAVGGQQPVTVLTAAQFAALLPRPRDGTFIRDATTGEVFRAAGGAPVYVKSWDNVGGLAPSVDIDHWNLVNVASPLAHLNAVPADGTFVRDMTTGEIFRVAGGAPLYVSTWNVFGGVKASVGLDHWAFTNITNPAAHLSAVPADGTFLQDMQSKGFFVVAGGAPLPVASWSVYGGPQPAVGVDPWVFANPFEPAAHLAAAPAVGTQVLALPSGDTWQFTGPCRVTTSADTHPVLLPDSALSARPACSYYQPVSPARVLDTRFGTTANQVSSPIAAGASLVVRVADVSGSPVPAGASAVALNVTVTQATSAGWVSVGPQAVTTSSNLNLTPGATVANLVVSALDGSGRVVIHNGSAGTVHVLADVQGYYRVDSGSLYQPTSPTRILDTRTGVTANPVRSSLPAGQSVVVRVAGVSGSPVPAGASAVALNVTVQARGAGWVSVGPQAVTTSSNLNLTAAGTVSNLVVSALDADGQVVIHNGSTGPVEVIADVQGFYLAGTGAMYQAVSPARVLDTRVGTAANAVRTSLAPGGSLVVRLAGVTGSPVPARASAVMLNVTVANAQSGGWVSVGPRAVSSSSNLNFTAGATLPNAVVSGLDGNGQVVIYNGSAGTVHVIADLQGYFLTPDA
ncbi:MAG: hypothetical protein ABI468_04545 [Candidatus Nanopelagicales bacterium]